MSGSSTTLALIGAYRRYVSPYKGFRCAAGVRCGRSCSDQGLRIFKRVSFLKGVALLQRQFDRCALAAQSLRVTEAARRLTGPRGQQGFCDIGGCDCTPGPGPDCTDCAPDADCCGSPRSGGACRGLAAECITCDACCDGDWGRRRSDSGSERADKARRREAERQARRDARRAHTGKSKDMAQ